MRIGSFFALLGFIMIIAGTFCPLLRPIVICWDVYQMNKPFGIVMLCVATAGGLGGILQQHKLTTIAAVISLILVVLLYLAAVMQVSTAFSFIPFKGISAGLTKLIRFKWGWYVLFTGAILAVVACMANRPPKKIIKPGEVSPL